ncbi:hypothetical protein PAPHI01_0661 [Pancytospora philotis]|nr:hypothetical protein PAPHI01_0661 [Pancytospora philotis]
MSDAAGRIMSGESVSLEDARAMLDKLGLSGGASSWTEAYNALSFDYSLPADFPEHSARFLVLQLFLKQSEPGHWSGPVVHCASGAFVGAEALEGNAPLSACLDELARVRAELEELRVETEQLRNACIDREYGNGYFVEEEVVQKIEEENCRLRRQNEDVYGRIAKAWFKLVEDKLKTDTE